VINSPGFWNDQNQARKISKQISIIREEISHIAKLDELRDELQTYLDLLDDDFNESLFREALDALEAQQTFIEKAEIECYLNEKYDHNDALL